MSRFSVPMKSSVVVVVIMVFAMLMFTGCRGGSSGSAGFVASVESTTFQGYPSSNGGGLPPVFRDEVQIIEFNGPISTGIFGGLFSVGGVPVVFKGVSSFSVGGVPYFAFADQVAARAAARLFDDGVPSEPLESVVVGLLSDGDGGVIAHSLVMDPKVPEGNPFSLPASLGLIANTQFDLHIPAGGGLVVNGVQLTANYGALPPVVVPNYTPSPSPSTIFETGPSFAPDTVPPLVAEVTTLSLMGADPNGVQIPFDDTIMITFSEPIDISTLNLQKNVLIRNTDVVTSQDPNGVLVPVNQTQNSSGSVFFFQPVPGFGEGPYTINVSVGENLEPDDDIMDLPAGATASQNSLANSSNVDFDTEFELGAQTAASLSETFEDDVNESPDFTPRYNLAPWNQNKTSGILEAFPLTGTSDPMAGNIGNRMQFPIAPTTPPPVTQFFSPFDDNGANNWGVNCNQNGGSRSQFIYLQTGMPNGQPEFPSNFADSIELVEWGVQNGLANPAALANFRLRMGHTTADAVNATSVGLTTNFDNNWDFTNPQNDFLMPTSHPAGAILPPNASPITLVPTSTYNVPMLASQFIPFPNLSILFDFDANADRLEVSLQTNTLRPPNLVVEVDIQPTVMPTNNFLLGNFPTAPTPIRRVNGQSGGAIGCNADAVASHMRFTTVGKNSANSTVFYDLGAAAANADFTTMSIIPDPAGRPAGTVYEVLVQTADSVSNGNAVSNDSGLLTFFDRDGNVDLSVLDQIDGRQFVRLEFRYESNTSTNESPFTDGFIIGFTF